jgi:hypothetical protein
VATVVPRPVSRRLPRNAVRQRRTVKSVALRAIVAVVTTVIQAYRISKSGTHGTPVAAREKTTCSVCARNIRAIEVNLAQHPIAFTHRLDGDVQCGVAAVGSQPSLTA